jgi:hypothetical protein
VIGWLESSWKIPRKNLAGNTRKKENIMLNKILCKLGLHNWLVYIRDYPYDICLHCGAKRPAAKYILFK